MYQNFVTKHDTAIQSIRHNVTSAISSMPPTGNIPIVNTGNIEAERTVIGFNASVAGTSITGSFIAAMKLDTSVADPYCVVSVGSNMTFAQVNYPILGLVRFESSADQPKVAAGSSIEVFPLELSVANGRSLSVKDCITVDVQPRTPGNNVFVGVICTSAAWTASTFAGTIAISQVTKEYPVLQPLK